LGQGLVLSRSTSTKDNREAAQLCWEKALALDRDRRRSTPCSASPIAWTPDSAGRIPSRRRWERPRLCRQGVGTRSWQCRRLYRVSMVLLMEGRHDEAVASARKRFNWRLARLTLCNSPLYSPPSGYPEEAIALCEKSMTLSPNYPAPYLGTLGDAYRQSGRTDEAIAAFEAYHARNPGFGLTMS